MTLTVPVVRGPTSAAIQATPTIPVDTAGNYAPPGGGGSQFFQGTTTPIGNAGGTSTGAARDVGVAAASSNSASYFNGFFFTDQAGTASLEVSNDSATWYQAASAPLVASTPLILSVPVMFRYHRTKVVNGATPEGVLVVNSSYTAG